MKVCVIGWYGTETIGDRAIIAGIYSIFNKVFDNFEINLGSLYPFYSERMINEDLDLYKMLVNKDLKIKLFNSRDKKELDRNIMDSDLLIMGGGPIMHIDELFMIEYAFKKAKKLNKKTGIIGCGIGPLFTEIHKKATLNIISNSDIVILRDKKSKEYLINICKDENFNLNVENVKVSLDPAVQCALEYKKKYKKYDRCKNEIVVNLRAFPEGYSEKLNGNEINKRLEEFILELHRKYYKSEIKLIPMHYFSIGNDDRVFLNSINLKNNMDNVNVQNKILSLSETMDVFINARFNIGMRYHSVVLQTILHGDNYILDYTEPNKGKISGFIEDIDEQGFYNNRMVCLQKGEKLNIDLLKDSNNDAFICNDRMIREKLNIYIEELEKVR